MRGLVSRGRVTAGCALVVAVGLTAAGYHVTKRISIPGDTGWDYITADTEGRRLYVPHRTEVVVLDLDTGAAVGRIAGLRDAHGVVVAREVGRGFVDASDPGSITIFDLKTLAAIEKVRVGDDPNGIFVSTGGGGGTLSIFHEDGPDTYSLVENVKTLAGARTMALDRKTGTVYLPVADVGPAPAPTADNPRPRARMVPGSFSVLVVGP